MVGLIFMLIFNLILYCLDLPYEMKKKNYSTYIIVNQAVFR